MSEDESPQSTSPPSPEFSKAPGEITAHANPMFFWIPTGDSHDFQLADNRDFENPLVDLQNIYDLSYTMDPGFPTDGSADKTYYYRVRARSGQVAGEWSVGEFEYKSNLPPKPEFTIRPAARTSDNQPHFEWAAAEDITAFEFQLSADGKFEEPLISEKVEKSSFTALTGFSDLGQNDGEYYYRVRSLLPDGEYSEWCHNEHTDRFELVTRPLPPAFLLRPALRTSSLRPRFAWDSSTALGARKFRFEISNTYDFSGQIIPYETQEVNEDAYLMDGRLPPGIYYYRICSIDHLGRASVWNYDPAANRFHLDPEKPNEPIVEVEEFITNVPMPISGTKDPSTSVLMNGETIVEADDEMAWSTQVEIFYGVNVLVFHTSGPGGLLSNPVVKICTYNPPMRNYDFYTRDSLDDEGEEPGEAEYGSGPDTMVFPPFERLKVEPDGGDDRENFDTDRDYELYKHRKEGTLREYLADPAMFAGSHLVDPEDENWIFIRVQNKGFLSGVCNFRLFWAPYSTWPKVSQWVEVTKEYEDVDGRTTRWHAFPDEIPGSNSGMIVSNPVIWRPDDPGFPQKGERGCFIAVIQADNIIEDPSFLLDRPLEGSYLMHMLDAYPEVFRTATYLSNNVTFKNINVVSDVSVEPKEGKRGRELLHQKDDYLKKKKPLFKDPQPRFWRERVLINGPSLKTQDASLVLDVSNFDENGSVWLKVPKDLLPPSRRLRATGGSIVTADEEMFPELRALLFDDPGRYLVYKVNNEYEMELTNIDLGLNQKCNAELVYGLSITADAGVQYTLSLIQRFGGKEVGRVMAIVKTQEPGVYRYFASVPERTLHRRECKVLKKLHGEDLRPFSNKMDAQLEGYTACGKCFMREY